MVSTKVDAEIHMVCFCNARTRTSFSHVPGLAFRIIRHVVEWTRVCEREREREREMKL